MLLTAALTLSLLGQWPSGHHQSVRAVTYRRHVGPWSFTLFSDRFAGKTTCSIDARGVTLARQTLVFRLLRGGDTTHTVFRIDNGPPHRVSDAFETVEAHGFFPQRGWIIDPAGGEVALPAAYLTDARVVTLRVSPNRNPETFKVERLAEAIAVAKTYDCLERPSKPDARDIAGR